MRFKDLTGTTYGRLTYIRLVGRNKFKQLLWEARCACGAALPAVRHRQAESCGCLLEERNHGPKPHSEEHCRRISEVRSRRETLHDCPVCGVNFFGTKHQRFCKLKCSREYRSRYDGRRERHWTRKTGARYEAVDFWKMYERDGGICKVCGHDCPKELRGNPHVKAAPTTGHVVPLSKGGDHSYENVQLECLGCNLSKSNDVPEGTPEPRLNPDPRTREQKISDRTKKQWADPSERARLLKAFSKRIQPKRGPYRKPVTLA